LDVAHAGGQGGGVGLRHEHFPGNDSPPAQKNELKPWQHEHWCIPTVGADFVAAMEDVLEEYATQDTPEHPLVCFDEKPVVLHSETRPSLPVASGRPARSDYEYERQGTANLFVMVEPLAGWRHIEVTERRTKLDYAHCLQWLVDVAYPQAESIRLVQDNLNTHQPSALYETFPPEEARRILRKLEFHYTLNHGSWLNMAEIEISVIERGCLSRPVGDVPTLCQRVEALETERNQARRTIQWQFTVQEARVTLQKLYPDLQTMVN
jgi:hypothetical protein